MAKVKWAVAAHKRRKRLLKKAKGYYSDRRTRIRKVRETVMKAQVYATRDRHTKKREIRSVWIIRLNAAARARGFTYSGLMSAFRKANVQLNRKQLSELAIHDQTAFDSLVAQVTAKA